MRSKRKKQTVSREFMGSMSHKLVTALKSPLVEVADSPLRTYDASVLITAGHWDGDPAGRTHYSANHLSPERIAELNPAVRAFHEQYAKQQLELLAGCPLNGIGDEKIKVTWLDESHCPRTVDNHYLNTLYTAHATSAEVF